jgi:hypothetical protein
VDLPKEYLAEQFEYMEFDADTEAPAVAFARAIEGLHERWQSGQLDPTLPE